MNIYTIRDNLKNTIAGKEQMLASMTEPTTNEAKQGWSIVHNMLSININELKRILQDVELAISEVDAIPAPQPAKPAGQGPAAREQLLVKNIEYEKAQAQKYFELYNQVCETAQLRLKEIARLESLLAAQRQPAARDDYRAWYDEAMSASNEAGFVGLDAAETIRELARQLAETLSTR